MLKDIARQLMQNLNFPLDAQKELLYSLDILSKNDEFKKIVEQYDFASFDFQKMIDDTKTLANNKGICVYTAHMLLFICLAPKLYKKYIEKGIGEKIFYDTMMDLRYKLEECRLVHGVYGTFVPNWYKGFFEMRIFALGRLQFEINNIWFDCEAQDHKITNGTKVLSVHIPRTGTPLNHDLVNESYSQAKQFFKEQFNNNIIFICNSWLLYPWNRTIYKEGSNLAQFYDDFTIVSFGDYQNYSESWRLFDCLYDGNLDKLPNNTSLRRAFIERIKNNDPIGHGTGVIIFD